MQVKFSSNFTKKYRKLPNKIKLAFDSRLEMFRKNPFELVLNNHGLVGKYRGCRSINVTGDWRAVYELIAQDIASFVALGTHSELYG